MIDPQKITNVILFDSSSKLQDLTNFTRKEDTMIITFDFESHKTLSENKIQHIISDYYLDKKDLEIVENNSYIIAKWFSDTKIVNILLYKDINLGELFHVEFHYMLVPFLKKFVELNKISKIYDKARYIASPNLFDAIRCFINNVIKINEISNTTNEFLYDAIKISFKFGNTSHSVKISRSYYLRLKSLSERFLQKLIGYRKYHSDFKSTLLVEFDTVRYQNIISQANKIPLNIILFNRRRPTIWNYESYSVIKKSNCIVEDIFSLSKKSINTSIKKGIQQAEEKIKLLWNQENHFESFFSINGISFWKAIKSNFIELVEKRVKEAIQEVEITEKLFNKYKFNSILVWSESGFNELVTISLAKKRGIPIMLLQHGLGYDTPEIPSEYREIGGVSLKFSDKFIVWGRTSQRYLRKCGVPDNKIEVIGSPKYDKIFEKEITNSGKGKYILLATSSPVKNLVNDLTIKTLENYEAAINKICEVVSSMDRKLLIKLHPFQDETDITQIVRKINPKIIVVKGGDIIPMIESCEAMVTVDISTSILEAQVLKKPVIVVSVKDYGWGKPEVFSSNSCIKTEINDFKSSLDKILNDVDYRQSLIENGSRFVNEYLSNQGRASIELLRFLEKL